MLIICAGNSDAGDDGVGPVVARHLRERGIPGIEIRNAGRNPQSIIELMEGRELVIIIDAMSSGARPGSIRCIDPRQEELPSVRSTSTHGFGVCDAVSLARALGTLPSRLLIIGVEGGEFTAGTELADAVEAAIPAVIDRIRQELEARTTVGSSRVGCASRTV